MIIFIKNKNYKINFNNIIDLNSNSILLDLNFIVYNF